jgi:hypothetical protein
MTNLFGTEVPTSTDVSDNVAYALGTVFTPDVDGTATHARWVFPLTGQPGGVQCEAAIYVAGTGVKISDPVDVQFSATPALGAWNEVPFTTPVPLTGGVEYMVVVWTPGRYVFTAGYPWPKVSGELTSANPAGRFDESPVMVMPASQFGTPSYFPDITFVADTDDVEGDGTLLLPALTSAGAGDVTVPGAGTLTLPALTSWMLYMLETNVRSATLVGLLTGTGIGFLFDLYYKSLNYPSAALVTLAIVIVVLALEAISNALRKVIL